MPALARIIPWLVIGFSLLALALGLYEWSHPPFTDEQIRASLAATFEVATSTTRVFVIVFLGLGAICVALARKAEAAGPRLVAQAAAVLCLLVLAVVLRNQVELAGRAAGSTGQDIGPAWGLL